MTIIRILFVCTGNICRSPTAEGVARVLAKRRGLADRFHFDSAGTHGYHVGAPPDPRTVAAAAKRGYDLSPLRARHVTSADFQDFDLLLAMDKSHLEILQRACPATLRHKLDLFLSHAEKHSADEVPDPYYGGEAGFEHVLDLVEDAASGLLNRLVSNPLRAVDRR